MDSVVRAECAVRVRGECGEETERPDKRTMVGVGVLTRPAKLK